MQIGLQALGQLYHNRMIVVRSSVAQTDVMEVVFGMPSVTVLLNAKAIIITRQSLIFIRQSLTSKKVTVLGGLTLRFGTPNSAS